MTERSPLYALVGLPVTLSDALQKALGMNDACVNCGVKAVVFTASDNDIFFVDDLFVKCFGCSHPRAWVHSSGKITDKIVAELVQ